jgi:hypothetical protein
MPLPPASNSAISLCKFMTGVEHCVWLLTETLLVNLKILMECGCLDHKDCVVSMQVSSFLRNLLPRS